MNWCTLTNHHPNSMGPNMVHILVFQKKKDVDTFINYPSKEKYTLFLIINRRVPIAKNTMRITAISAHEHYSNRKKLQKARYSVVR
jgi:hypothetical protein